MNSPFTILMPREVGLLMVGQSSAFEAGPAAAAAIASPFVH